MKLRPLLVGESNPYGVDPRFALYPHPQHASGGRLARILGLTSNQYIRQFLRANLLTEPGDDFRWDSKEAQHAARCLQQCHAVKVPFVLLGRKVCAAFGLPRAAPFTEDRVLYPDEDDKWRRVLILPHPSGRNRVWNVPGTEDLARSLVLGLLEKSTSNT